MATIYIKILKKIPLDELEEKVRSVPLKKQDEDGNTIFVYKNANIQVREVSPEEINPTTFYLIENNLKFQRELREFLIDNYDVDHLSLYGGLEIENEKGEIWTLMPPVVELMEETVKYVNDRGDINYDNKPTKIKVPIINDGAHRVYLAKELGLLINVFWITGIPAQEHPFYAMPNSWDDVKIFQNTPETMEGKKFYRRTKSYDLYRDFGVLGCGAPRHTGKSQ